MMIVSDLDGVLSDTTSGVCQVLWDRLQRPFAPSDVRQWDTIGAYVALHPTANYAEAALVLNAYCWNSEEFYEGLIPYWDIWRIYHEALKEHDITFVTARPPARRIENATCEWLTRWGFGQSEVKFLDPEQRLDFLQKQKGDVVVYVEDKLSTMQALSRRMWPPTLIPFLINRPWNQVESDTDYHRGDSRELRRLLCGR